MVFIAALAAEIVSFWICISVALFVFLSPNIVFPEDIFVAVPESAGLGGDTIDCCEGGGTAGSADPDDLGTVPGSAVIRSINVVPDEES